MATGNNSLIPAVRFPGCTKPWRICTLGDIADFVPSMPASQAREHIKFLRVSPKGISYRQRKILCHPIYPVESGDILYNASNLSHLKSGFFVLSDKSGFVGDFNIVFRVKHPPDRDIVYAYLQSYLWLPWIEKHSGREIMSVTRIYSTNLKYLPIPLPECEREKNLILKFSRYVYPQLLPGVLAFLFPAMKT